MPRYVVVSSEREVPEFEGARDEFTAWVQEQGFKLADQPTYEKPPAMWAHLKGEPLLAGFTNPRIDGGTIRYEDWKVSDFLSR